MDTTCRGCCSFLKENPLKIMARLSPLQFSGRHTVSENLQPGDDARSEHQQTTAPCWTDFSNVTAGHCAEQVMTEEMFYFFICVSHTLPLNLPAERSGDLKVRPDNSSTVN